MRLTILHTNDIHGRIDGLARIATLVERERATADHPVLYVDVGDIEESTVHVSNVTKGAGMHRILSAAGCDVACVGNATWLRYGPQVLADAAKEASYPLLVANLRPVPGTHATARLGRAGFVGITDPFPRFVDSFDYGIESLPMLPLVRELARRLRGEGAELVILLSHVGYENPHLGTDDCALARELDGEVDLIVGAHSHTLLREGDRSHGIPIAQAGAHAEHLGRIEIDGDSIELTVMAVGEAVPPSPAVLAAVADVEREADAFLDEEVGVLAEPIDADFVAEVMRARMGADVGIAIANFMLDRDLPPGPLTRRALWEACHSTANPGVAEIGGDRLAAMIERGNDPAFQQATTGPLRGRPRGRLAVVGLDGPLDPQRVYRVAGTDAELDMDGLIEEDWQLEVRYDFPTIVREAIEEHVRR